MDYCSEIRDFIDANVEGAVFGEELGFALFSSGAMPGTVIIAEPVDALTLEMAEQQSHRLSLLLSGLEGKKAVIVPEDVWRSRPEMTRRRILAPIRRINDCMS